jgi:hypothetical protein
MPTFGELVRCGLARWETGSRTSKLKRYSKIILAWTADENAVIFICGMHCEELWPFIHGDIVGSEL